MRCGDCDYYRPLSGCVLLRKTNITAFDYACMEFTEIRLRDDRRWLTNKNTDGCNNDCGNNHPYTKRNK